MSFYGGLAATANRLLAQYGRVITFSHYSPEVDGVAGTVDRGSPETCTANAVILPASQGTIQAFDNRREELALAKKELRYMKVAALGMTFEPHAFDEATFDGATWQVLGCTPVNPAGTALVYGVGVVKL